MDVDRVLTCCKSLPSLEQREKSHQHDITRQFQKFINPLQRELQPVNMGEFLTYVSKLSTQMLK